MSSSIFESLSIVTFIFLPPATTVSINGGGGVRYLWYQVPSGGIGIYLPTPFPVVLTSSGGHRNTYGWQAGVHILLECCLVDDGILSTVHYLLFYSLLHTFISEGNMLKCYPVSRMLIFSSKCHRILHFCFSL